MLHTPMSNQQFEEHDDAMTLARAEEIKGDKKRLAGLPSGLVRYGISASSSVSAPLRV